MDFFLNTYFFKKIPQTIRSRLQTIRFPALSPFYLEKLASLQSLPPLPAFQYKNAEGSLEKLRASCSPEIQAIDQHITFWEKTGNIDFNTLIETASENPESANLWLNRLEQKIHFLLLQALEENPMLFSKASLLQVWQKIPLIRKTLLTPVNKKLSMQSLFANWVFLKNL